MSVTRAGYLAALAVGTTQRNGLQSLQPGTLVFNTDTNNLELYDGAVWIALRLQGDEILGSDITGDINGSQIVGQLGDTVTLDGSQIVGTINASQLDEGTINGGVF